MNDVTIAGIVTGADLSGKIIGIIDAFLALAAVVAVIFVIYGGIKYMMSAGDDKDAVAGKNAVMFAIIGLIIVGLAAVIVNFTAQKIGK